MGAWSTSIHGNDTAQDLKSEYQAAFYYYNEHTAVKKIEEYVRGLFDENDEEEWCDYLYSLADYMWKHGRLTEEIRSQAIQMIDSGFGLELWAESGEKILQKRKRVLEEFRNKLLSPQPPKKKIAMKLYREPIFEIGDLVAIQLQTANKHYISGSSFSETEFRSYDGCYVVLRKATDIVSYTSAIVPEVKDIWPLFQLYGKIFDHCPEPAELDGIPWADPSKKRRKWHTDLPYNGIFVCEGSMFYFRKRKFQRIGNSLHNMPDRIDYAQRDGIYLGIDRPFANADTEILNAIL